MWMVRLMYPMYEIRWEILLTCDIYLHRSYIRSCNVRLHSYRNSRLTPCSLFSIHLYQPVICSLYDALVILKFPMGKKFNKWFNSTPIFIITNNISTSVQQYFQASDIMIQLQSDYDIADCQRENCRKEVHPDWHSRQQFNSERMHGYKSLEVLKTLLLRSFRILKKNQRKYSLLSKVFT